MADDDFHSHHDAILKKTGFYGSRGAGAVIFSKTTKRFLLAHRSAHVEQPHTWGVWGGAINPGEDIKTALMREVREETGFRGKGTLIPVYVFAKDNFRYYNFICVVDDEFTPTLDWETQGFRWCEFGHWPSPLHFGVTALLKDPETIATIKSLMRDDVLEHLMLKNETPEIITTDDGLRITVNVAGGSYEITHADGFWNITTNTGVEIEGRGRTVDEALEMILRSV